ncbi:helix-turn-helix domain-containing protein [Promicromonospora iranensis]|jgi:putative transcriptional regulator|uniref:helix-turn-helix domain-containing protein n=1 Tax=Promicromonospora iranensis TaxID=1105144 RepID=UPI0023AA1710|nr:helix-turn-helix transcriptional regulator [Promicromonospora iranensis]
MAIVVEIDVLLAKRKMSVGDFADAIGLSPANVSVLKNGRAKAVRFSTLDAICEVLGCQPGDVLRWVPDDGDDESGAAPSGKRRLTRLSATPGDS